MTTDQSAQLAKEQLLGIREMLEEKGYDAIYANALEFISLSPDDRVFKDVTVIWDDEYKEIDFRWDTKHLDCRASIGAEGYSWKVWAGDNNHSKDDRCDAIGIGGNEITPGKDWAFWFYDYMFETITELDL